MEYVHIRSREPGRIKRERGKARAQRREARSIGTGAESKEKKGQKLSEGIREEVRRERRECSRRD